MTAGLVGKYVTVVVGLAVDKDVMALYYNVDLSANWTMGLGDCFFLQKPRCMDIRHPPPQKNTDLCLGGWG